MFQLFLAVTIFSVFTTKHGVNLCFKYIGCYIKENCYFEPAKSMETQSIISAVLFQALLL